MHPDLTVRHIPFSYNILQQELDTYNIPLAIRTFTKRKTIPEEVISLAREWNSSHIFANLEYEVDELRRDIQLCELAQESNDVEVVLEHDYLLTIPGKVMTPKNTPYSVFSPFHKAWSALMVKDLNKYSQEFPMPKANEDSIRENDIIGKLFQDEVPNKVDGFEMPSEEYSKHVRDLYPPGTDVAEQVRGIAAPPRLLRRQENARAETFSISFRLRRSFESLRTTKPRKMDSDCQRV